MPESLLAMLEKEDRVNLVHKILQMALMEVNLVVEQVEQVVMIYDLKRRPEQKPVVVEVEDHLTKVRQLVLVD